MHCVGHEGALIVKDICKIQTVEKLLTWMTDCQHWFSTNKLKPLLKGFCVDHYGTDRSFIFPAETRFAGKLLQIKRFLDMKAALRQCVNSAQYLRFDFDNDIFAEKISDAEIWSLMDRIVTTAGPVLLLLRLADSNTGSLSKLKGVVDYISTKLMVDKGTDTLEDKICTAFANRAPELESDISNAAWIIDPQFVAKSRKAPPNIMKSFWSVSRKVLRVTDDAEWVSTRAQMVTQLAKFRMATDGFLLENYSTEDTCAFWSVAGCHAPILRDLAMRLASLPCSTGEAERNWFEVKINKTKIRNRLRVVGRDVLAKMIFVRRFIRLKRKVSMDASCAEFKSWASNLFKRVTEDDSSASSSASGEDSDRLRVFYDIIEPEEQGRINGREPGKPEVNLTDLKKDHASKSWLFEKYYNIAFVDKNPEGGPDDSPLDESEWEHRVIKDIVWWRRKGWCVETCLRGGTVTHQSIVNYQINSTLHAMIRDSPHNLIPMHTTSTNSDTERELWDSDEDSDE